MQFIRINGLPVSVHYTMPVNFSLQDEQQVETDTPKLATQVIDGDIYLVKDKDANRVILQHPIKGEITIYTYLQKMPEPKYDIYKFISKNIQYPIAAKEEKIEGTVAVIVIVTETGKIKFTRVAKSIHTLLDEEAKRIINTLPDWIPGIQSGQPVNSYYMIPVKFEL